MNYALFLKLVIGGFFLNLLSSCVVGFSNAQNHVPSIFSKIYIPAANDTSIYSGNASRLSYAVRDILSNRTDVQLAHLEDARVALQLKILNRQQTITAVDNCSNPGNATVASGAFACSLIHPELTGNSNSPSSFNQPSTSPSTENLYLVVNAKLIDLNNGKLLWGKRYYAANVSPIAFNEIGDIDGRTVTNMSNLPDLHGLRYQEAIDNAVQAFANTIANDLQSALFTNLPTN